LWRRIRTGVEILTEAVKYVRRRGAENLTRLDIAGGRLADWETSVFAISRRLWRTIRGPGFVRDQRTPGPLKRGGGKEKAAPPCMCCNSSTAERYI
jgi:hypothetical protein